jgi:hypothetical protein
MPGASSRRRLRSESSGSDVPQTAPVGQTPSIRVSVGDEVKILSDGAWWQATVLRARICAENGQEEVHYRWAGHKTARPNAWIATNDPRLRLATASTSKRARYMDHWQGKGGHVRRDEWIADRLLRVRGEGDEREFLVHWQGWPSTEDSWEPVEHILDSALIEDFEAERQRLEQEAAEARLAARQAKEQHANEQARRERAQYAEHFIDTVRADLIKELERGRVTKCATACVIVREKCADWQMQALHEHLMALVPEGEQQTSHLTPLVQTKGQRGAPIVSFEFHVRSHLLSGRFLGTGGVNPARWEHVAYKRNGAGMAVCLLPTWTFTRRGPRSDPTQIKLTVTAGIAVLAARNKHPPDPRFADDVSEGQAQTHVSCIAARVRDIARRAPSVRVQRDMLAYCARCNGL